MSRPALGEACTNCGHRESQHVLQSGRPEHRDHLSFCLVPGCDCPGEDCPSGICLPARERWRLSPEERAKDITWARAHGVPIQCPDELEGRPCSCKPPRPS